MNSIELKNTYLYKYREEIRKRQHKSWKRYDNGTRQPN